MHAAIFQAPILIGRTADTVLTAKARNRNSILALFQNSQYLTIVKFRSLHDLLHIAQHVEKSNYEPNGFRG